MLSFKQHITEKSAKLSAVLPYKGAKWKNFRGLENPTERELVANIKKAKFFSLRRLYTKISCVLRLFNSQEVKLCPT